jgi:Cu(I)/Ag(I) efflux system membrane fusion protein
MQLAGKPSLIDPERAIARSKNKQGPLQFESVSITPIGGEEGQQLESLFSAYFQVQQALAADKKPSPASARALHDSASRLSGNSALPLPEAAAKLVQEVAAKSEHLHHMDLAEARKTFKPISHAVVTLATQVRGEGAQNPFTHFYCPMVKEGGGDWLQANDQLLNPYFGSEMLRCGEKVHQFPAQGAADSSPDPHREHRATPAKKGAA